MSPRIPRTRRFAFMDGKNAFGHGVYRRPGSRFPPGRVSLADGPVGGYRPSAARFRSRGRAPPPAQVIRSGVADPGPTAIGGDRPVRPRRGKRRAKHTHKIRERAQPPPQFARTGPGGTAGPDLALRRARASRQSNAARSTFAFRCRPDQTHSSVPEPNIQHGPFM